jgi:hypothetical protein
MTTVYKQQCVDWGEAIRAKVEEFYGPRIVATEKLISDAIAKNLDPQKVVLEDGIATINYEALLTRTNDAKSASLAGVDSQVAACDKDAVPDWLADPQKKSDYALTIAMLPYVALTQQYAAAKVDLGEVYKGHPLGGDGALIPKAREEVLNALGIKGEQAEWLRDPVNKTTDIVRNAIPKIDIQPIEFPHIEFPKIDPPKIDPPKVDVPTPGKIIEDIKDIFN